MTFSRIVGILAAISGFLSIAAAQLEYFKPGIAHIIAAVALGITAFTERIQGGLSKNDQ